MKPNKTNIITILVGFAAVSLIVFLVLLFNGSFKKNKEPVMFAPGVERGEHVYADIVSITPYMGTTMEYSHTSLLDVICCAKTAEGNIIYVVMDPVVYIQNFDANADLEGGIFQEYAFETVNFSPAVRIQGIAKAPEDIDPDLEEKLGVELVLQFERISSCSQTAESGLDSE